MSSDIHVLFPMVGDRFLIETESKDFCWLHKLSSFILEKPSSIAQQIKKELNSLLNISLNIEGEKLQFLTCCLLNYASDI